MLRAIFVAAVAVAGCVPAQVMPLTSARRVELITTATPRPYTELALIRTVCDVARWAQCLERVRYEAGKVGADAAIITQDARFGRFGTDIDLVATAVRYDAPRPPLSAERR
jgi:hypothetical protein